MKEGYKETELGWLPKEWEVKKIEDVLDIFPTASYSRADLSTDGEIQYLHYGDIHTKFDFHLKINSKNLPKISFEKLKNYKTLKVGDLVMTDASEDYKGVGKAVEIMELSGNETIAGLHTFLLRDKNKNFTLGFKGYLTISDTIKKQFHRIAVGSKVYSLSKTNLQNLTIPLPPLPEQKAIAYCLSIWDRAIESQKKLIKAKEKRKKALMQQLLRGKKRLSGFTEEWKEFSYSQVIKQVTRKEQWDDSKIYNLISVKRRSGGIFARQSLYGRQIEVKQLVKVKENDFLISKMQIVHGASSIVRKEFEDYYVSGSYVILNIKDENVLTPFYLDYMSKQKIFYHQTYIASYGVHIEKMTFDFKSFLKMKITLPSLLEQEKITKIIDTAEKEIQI